MTWNSQDDKEKIVIKSFSSDIEVVGDESAKTLGLRYVSKPATSLQSAWLSVNGATYGFPAGLATGSLKLTMAYNCKVTATSTCDNTP
jgi:hypothetical protein